MANLLELISNLLSSFFGEGMIDEEEHSVSHSNNSGKLNDRASGDDVNGVGALKTIPVSGEGESLNQTDINATSTAMVLNAPIPTARARRTGGSNFQVTGEFGPDTFRINITQGTIWLNKFETSFYLFVAFAFFIWRSLKNQKPRIEPPKDDKDEN
ncbi:hypothetical protein PHJA_000615600 [Phtheirospermum japonicum]|uniref:Uncharacterized protein n=1 Tax=Phtheirospermum japonicum TaxID=374723 RepID=A0A830BCA3_9LAMI|nr:hypothetical protein PHJA_000615600 [Phtheirospermum japonicum]